MVAAATVVVCTLYIYSAVCMMLRIAILIAGWLSCHRPLWCMTASVHSPRVRTSSAHNISLRRWMADSQDASHGRSSSSTFIFFNFHFLSVTCVPFNKSCYLHLFIFIIHPYPYNILCEVCLRCVTSGQVLHVASGTLQKSVFWNISLIIMILYLYPV